MYLLKIIQDAEELKAKTVHQRVYVWQVCALCRTCKSDQAVHYRKTMFVTVVMGRFENEQKGLSENILGGVTTSRLEKNAVQPIVCITNGKQMKT